MAAQLTYLERSVIATQHLRNAVKAHVKENFITSAHPHASHSSQRVGIKPLAAYSRPLTTTPTATVSYSTSLSDGLRSVPRLILPPAKVRRRTTPIDWKQFD